MIINSPFSKNIKFSWSGATRWSGAVGEVGAVWLIMLFVSGSKNNECGEKWQICLSVTCVTPYYAILIEKYDRCHKGPIRKGIHS